jgi:Zn-dependent protease/CBS domain-containing protein
MFPYGINLFRAFGIPIRLDWSWFIIALLITWSLATGFFPASPPLQELGEGTFWLMGVAGALGLFASIVLHELGHAVVAQRRGMGIRGITLFIFGGVAELEDEPPDAKTEFLVAIGGPVVSVLLGVLFLLAGSAGKAAGAPIAVTAVLGWLGMINLVLVVFNMLPGFPLDGGRVLRSALWAWKKSLRWATRVTSLIGSGFGILLIVLGVVVFVRGSFIAGMWFFLIGLFLRAAAQASYQQVLVRQMLRGEPVRRFMKPDPVTVPSSITLREMIDSYLYRHHFSFFPVVENDKLVGCISASQLKEVPREEWDHKRVGEVVRPCSRETTISPDEDATRALAKMNRAQVSRLLVREDGRLVGVLSLRDLMDFFALKIDLEGS